MYSGEIKNEIDHINILLRLLRSYRHLFSLVHFEFLEVLYERVVLFVPVILVVLVFESLADLEVHDVAGQYAFFIVHDDFFTKRVHMRVKPRFLRLAQFESPALENL